MILYNMRLFIICSQSTVHEKKAAVGRSPGELQELRGWTALVAGGASRGALFG